MWNWDYTNVDNGFFEEQTQELAYIIGFFMADGHISNYNKCGKYNVSFFQRSSDRDVLEKISKICGYKNKVLDFKCGMSRVVFAGKFIWQFFTDLGFDNNKTFTSVIPKLIKNNEDLYLSFIRGVFDGDGSLSIRSRTRSNVYPSVNVVGNECTVEFISKVLTFYNNKKPYKNIFRVDYSGENAVKFLNLIYKNSTIYMDRKYNLYKQIKHWKVTCKRWTPEEKAFVRENYSTMYAKDIAIILNKSPQAVSDFSRRLGIKRQNINGKI